MGHRQPAFHQRPDRWIWGTVACHDQSAIDSKQLNTEPIRHALVGTTDNTVAGGLPMAYRQFRALRRRCINDADFSFLTYLAWLNKAGTAASLTACRAATDDETLIPSCTKIMPTYTSVCAKCGKVYEFKATVAERINNRPECCGKRLKALFTQFLERWISQQRSNRLAGS